MIRSTSWNLAAVHRIGIDVSAESEPSGQLAFRAGGRLNEIAPESAWLFVAVRGIANIAHGSIRLFFVFFVLRLLCCSFRERVYPLANSDGREKEFQDGP
jgi:hypothetical protein